MGLGYLVTVLSLPSHGGAAYIIEAIDEIYMIRPHLADSNGGRKQKRRRRSARTRRKTATAAPEGTAGSQQTKAGNNAKHTDSTAPNHADQRRSQRKDKQRSRTAQSPLR